MSPTEDDLRTALSDGDGDTPDVEHIVFVARETRARRRRRLLSAATTVIVVGGIAAGGTVLVEHGSPPESAGGSTGSGTGGDRVGGTANGGARRQAAGSAAVPSAASAPSATSTNTTASGELATCPSGGPKTLLPGGGGTNQFGAHGALFTQPVDTVTVCAAPTVASTGGSTRITLTGSDATTFIDSLENAPKIRPDVACPQYRTTDQASLAIIATTAAGRTLPTVTTTINEPVCAVVVTNGTAVRYDWSWPATLSSQLADLRAAAGPGR